MSEEFAERNECKYAKLCYKYKAEYCNIRLIQLLCAEHLEFEYLTEGNIRKQEEKELKVKAAESALETKVA